MPFSPRYALLVLALLTGLPRLSSGHTGDRLYPIFEIADRDLDAIDLDDGSVAEWRALLGPPSFITTDFAINCPICDDDFYYPASLDFALWLGWNRSTNRLYFAIERMDNRYVNEYGGGNPRQMWRHDSIEVMIDGDHGGEEYGFGEQCCDTEGEFNLRNNRKAQQYFAIAQTPDGVHVGYWGAGTDWVIRPPRADGGGGWDGGGLVDGGPPAITVTEFYVTPFDDLIWNDPAMSRESELAAGKIIGFEIFVPDFDAAPSAYTGFDHRLSGDPSTWRFADRFVDGLLVGAGSSPTNIDDTTWGRIKASLK